MVAGIEGQELLLLLLSSESSCEVVSSLEELLRYCLFLGRFLKAGGNGARVNVSERCAKEWERYLASLGFVEVRKPLLLQGKDDSKSRNHLHQYIRKLIGNVMCVVGSTGGEIKSLYRNHIKQPWLAA